MTHLWKIRADLTRAGSARLFYVLDTGEVLGERSWDDTAEGSAILGALRGSGISWALRGSDFF